jgi:hypothetical protein
MYRAIVKDLDLKPSTFTVGILGGAVASEAGVRGCSQIAKVKVSWSKVRGFRKPKWILLGQLKPFAYQMPFYFDSDWSATRG